MLRVLRLAHFCGLAVFLGSIVVFVVVSVLIEGASQENIAFGRRIISTGTTILTLPAMWLLGVSGVWMGWKRYGPGQRFFRIKLLIVAIIILNAHFVVVPAAASATELAQCSTHQERLLPEYRAAYMRESIFGAVNVLLIVAAAVVGVWKIGAVQAHTSQTVK